MIVLIACEESQTVCKAFRERGHQAFSCDTQECSGGHPEWHFKDDIFNIINGGILVTQSRELIEIKQWDLMIGHPPCTFISYAGIRWFNIEKYGEKAVKRYKDKDDAIIFFKALYNAPIGKICLENPKGFIMNEMPPSQTIQPYYFGDSCSKTTLLWLKNLPKLYHNKIVNLFDDKVTHVFKGEMCKSGSEQLFGKHTLSLTKKERSKLRSKTFDGIANAMAEQWG